MDEFLGDLLGFLGVGVVFGGAVLLFVCCRIVVGQAMLVGFSALGQVGHVLFEGVLITQKPQFILQQVLVKGVHERVAY